LSDHEGFCEEYERDNVPFIDGSAEEIKRFKYCASYAAPMVGEHDSMQQVVSPHGAMDNEVYGSDFAVASPVSSSMTNYFLYNPNDYLIMQQQISDAYYQGLYQNYLYSNYLKTIQYNQALFVNGEFKDNGKKRKAPQKKFARRVRAKITPGKGAIQCIGKNRKTGNQCRNAALMEYFGPKPKFCAEHIHLDEDCLYTKCCSPYHKKTW